MAIHGKDDLGQEHTVLTDEDGRVVVAGDGLSPVPVCTPKNTPVSTRELPGLAVGLVGQTKAIPSSAASYPLPEYGGTYQVSAVGGTAYLRWDGGTATTSVGGFTVAVPSSGWMVLRIPGNSVSYIGTAAVGFVTFLHLKG